MTALARAVGRWIARWYPVGAALAVWEAIAWSGLVPRLIMPTVEAILAAFVSQLAGGDLLFHTGISLSRSITGLAGGIVAGILLGLLMARSGRFEQYVEPLFSFGYPIPKIALYPIFIFVFGLGSPSIIALVILDCLYPVAVNTYAGMKSVERIHVWSARNMGASPRQLFWRVLLPSAAPYIFSSIRVASQISFIVVIILEMIGASRGLGYFVSYASVAFEFDTAFAGLMMIAICGFTFDRIIMALRDRAVFWERSEPAR